MTYMVMPLTQERMHIQFMTYMVMPSHMNFLSQGYKIFIFT